MAPVSDPQATRPDPDVVRARALGGPWRLSALLGASLLALAAGAPGWTGGDPRAALLPGVPGVLQLGLFWLGTVPRRRRWTMALSTATAGALALATVSSLGALGARDTDRPGADVLFQVACFAFSALFLAATVRPWQRVNEEGDVAEAELRMFEEL